MMGEPRHGGMRGSQSWRQDLSHAEVSVDGRPSVIKEAIGLDPLLQALRAAHPERIYDSVKEDDA